jgi:hypothetical protein
MDYIDYSPPASQQFPTVSASAASPKTLYASHTGVVYVNTGSGWQPGVQPSSNSVYTAVSTASAATKAAVITSISNTATAQSPAHTVIVTKAVNVINNGH